MRVTVDHLEADGVGEVVMYAGDDEELSPELEIDGKGRWLKLRMTTVPRNASERVSGC